MRTFSITDVGMVRQVNQDYVYVTDRPLGILQNLFVVADGMGGHQAGDYASKYTVEVLNRELALSEGEDIERCLVGAIKTANREIIKEASRDEHLKGMGTTVVAATISNQMMYFANVGDSRLYLINQGIQQLTKDHSLVEEMVRLGGIKPEEAKHHPDKNIITRAIGAKADVEVDFYEHRLKKGDIILMCTDGLSNMVEDEELFHIVQGSRDIVEAGEMLVEAAKENAAMNGITNCTFLADDVLKALDYITEKPDLISMFCRSSVHSQVVGQHSFPGAFPTSAGNITSFTRTGISFISLYLFFSRNITGAFACLS